LFNKGEYYDIVVASQEYHDYCESHVLDYMNAVSSTKFDKELECHCHRDKKFAQNIIGSTVNWSSMFTEKHVEKLPIWQIRFLLRSEFLLPPKEIPSNKGPLVALYW
jgi:hypothetical protein